ncbi:RDD family protein [candidate division WWE3 bacterium]|jgi:uncharacterized RDD family membrane protein YckC|nr:RDD family protein [candidate division WWE3 bacterium]MBT7350422.1 RDD family protein [candidate division WWE3 bacterium]
MNEELDKVNETSVEEPMKDESPSKDYATFWARLGAFLIDAILISTVAGFFTGGTYVGDGSVSFGSSGSLPALLGAAYHVLLVSKYGATLGKMALKIRVENIDTGKNLTIVEAILREVVGKFVSTLAVLLGYFWMLWDPEKQTWHDKIGKSVVVKASAVKA